MKKRVLSCVVFGLLVGMLFMSSNVMAATKSMAVTVEEGDFSIKVPYDCYVLHQQISDNDAYITLMGADKSKIESYYRDNGIILHVISKDNTYEMVVTQTHNQKLKYIYNMKSLSNDTIEKIKEAVSQSYLSYGYQMKEESIYENEEMKFVLFHFAQTVEDKTVDCIQYFMIKDSKVYNFTMRYYGKEMPQEIASIMETMVNSIKFSKAELIHSFSDQEIGVSFEVEKGWDKVSSDYTGDVVRGQFLHTNGLGESIQILSIDLWAQMDAMHQMTKPREKYNLFQILNQDEIKSYCEQFQSYLGNIENVTAIQIGDLWYLVSNAPVTVQEQQIQGVYVQKNAITIREGIAYIYQYGYFDGNNIHETDYEQMLHKITYTEPDLQEKDKQYLEKIQALQIGMITMIVLVMGILFFIVYLYMTGNESEKN